MSEIEFSRMQQRLEYLEEWQRRQNGTLQHLEGQLDRIQWWLVLIAGGVATACVMLLIQTSAK